VLTAGQERVRRRSFAERKRPRDRNLDVSVERHSQGLCDLIRRREPEPEDPVTVTEEFDEVEVNDLTCMCTAGHEAPVGPESPKVRAEQIASHGIDDSIDALPTGELVDYLAQRLPFVAERFIRTQRKHSWQLLGITYRRDD
jgi:hypothetical protein